MILLVLIPILWAMPIGLYCSELTNLAPVESGPYVWAKMAFGEFWGFSFGFCISLAMYLTGAAYVVLAADYIGLFVNLTPLMSFAIKAAIIIIFTIVNLMGLEEGKYSQYDLQYHYSDRFCGCGFRRYGQLAG